MEPDKMRTVLDGWYSLQATKYLEFLAQLTEDHRPKTRQELVDDFIEWLATP